MMRQVSKARLILKSRRGETLMESIASTLVLTILLAAITTMLLVSLRMTSVSIADATASRKAADEILAYNVSPTPGTVKLEFDGTGEEIELDVDVYSNTTHGFTAFKFEPGGP